MAQAPIASANRLFETLDREPQIESPPDAPPLPAGGGRGEMRSVSLRYDGASPALTGIDLAIEAGRTLALVGPPGSGKTSLLALIAPPYHPSEGAGTID